MQLSRRILSPAAFIALATTSVLAQSAVPASTSSASSEPVKSATLPPPDTKDLSRGDVNDWTWLVAPYFWAAGIDGSLTTNLTGKVDFSVSFDDIWDNLDSAGLVFLEVRKEQFSVLGDFIYMGLSSDETTSGGLAVDADVNVTIAELAGMYRLTPNSPYELGAGVRYGQIDVDFDVGALSHDNRRDSFDGFGAGRASWPIAKHWSATAYGDIGAGNSELTWQASGMFGYHFDGWGLGAGYRALGYKFDSGSNEANFTMHGLVFGAEFRF
jgi:hypothetical protein